MTYTGIDKQTLKETEKVLTTLGYKKDIVNQTIEYIIENQDSDSSFQDALNEDFNEFMSLAIKVAMEFFEMDKKNSKKNSGLSR